LRVNSHPKTGEISIVPVAPTFRASPAQKAKVRFTSAEGKQWAAKAELNASPDDIVKSARMEPPLPP
jgi:hypothetical protein